MTKIEHSTKLIRDAIGASKRPAAMLSFGKDSMVMAHLIRGNSNEFPIDVIYHRDPWFPHKHEFADRTIRSWAMSVHDFPPMHVGVKVKPDMLELVARYNFGVGTMDIPKNVCEPKDYPRREFICGLNDWLMRPKGIVGTPWDTVFIGHRSADIDPFEGAVPLKSDETKIGGVRVVFPLRDWTDDELWDYIEANHVPVQETRYKNRVEFNNKWYINDYTHACTACVDPRNKAESVFCPKLKKGVPNRGAEVLQLHVRPEYIEAQEAA
jgi:3'-phosphoadenosine 5'-phosphosulfate sulfotransferase (PAPS reductase)/FAD synthetase